ncbi:GTPase Era [Desulfurivibrio sp. D14AmB]|uniref:GTPase Era n=1 Tax=Desulfurivibrio sp. D14AmB TaxID=3374370 RepID=UPI00376F12E8
MHNDPAQEIACGFVALVGPPNAGKSTLLNRLLGQKISIVTPKPQTTRNRILGVVNGPGYQLILLDTPGLHRARTPLNSEMVKIARNTVKEVDAVAYMIDAGLPDSEHQREAAELLRGAGKPALLLCNKIDRIGKERLLPLISAWQEVYPFQAIIPVSAMNGEGCEIFLDQASRLLPTGPRLFPDDLPTDASERFICGEIIREKIMLLTKDELPYSVAVVIEGFSEEPERNLTTIHATIMVEKDSQKGIIIGNKGSMLQRIGQTSRREIEALLGVKVLLKLWVKVQKNWTANRRVLQELGF